MRLMMEAILRVITFKSNVNKGSLNMKNNDFKNIVIAIISIITLSACHSENDHKTGNHKKNGHPTGHNNRPGQPSGPPIDHNQQHGDHSSSNGKIESFTYNFDLNGCKTGKHQFNSLEEMCMGLQNDTLNNSCASELRVNHFQTFCPNQTYQPFKDSKVNNDNPDLLPSSRDHLKGEVLIRTLYAGESSLVLFKNPTGESARTLVYCTDNKHQAKKVLTEPGMGGMIITKGTKIVMKNDTSNAFNDGSSLKGTYIQFECQ